MQLFQTKEECSVLSQMGSVEWQLLRRVSYLTKLKAIGRYVRCVCLY